MLLPFLLALALQTAPDPAAVKPAAADAGETPHGAPTDDYGFVSWCRGALSGHMELYPAVKTEMQKVEEEKAAKEDSRYTTDAERESAVKRRVKEALDDTKLDEEQLAAGRTYLKLYSDALTAAEGASAANLRKRGEEAQDAGYRIWAAARGAEPRTKMWSWVMWELPARCETAARRLLDRSSLLAGALKPQPVAEKVETPAETPAETVVAKADDVKIEAAKPDAPKSDAVEPEAAKPAAADAEKPTISESKLEDVKPAPSNEQKAADAKTDDAKAPESKPADNAKPAEPASPSSDGPVIRRRTETPADAPDAPHPDPKP